jgi:uncharacterized protein YdeI (YjbR/CyaY-like superfamily)
MKADPHPKDGLPIVAFAGAADFQAWLERHRDRPGAWLKLARKGSGIASVTYAAALDIALCYGWIDGQTGKLDDAWTLRRFTPRRSRSRWSQINCKRAEELAAEGKMQARGLREMDAAKSDGRWDAAYAPARTITAPEDFLEALKAHPEAQRFFEQISAQNRYAVLYRIQDAKKPETRVRRIGKFVAMLQEGKTLH